MKGKVVILFGALGLMGLGIPFPVQEVPYQPPKLDIVPIEKNREPSSARRTPGQNTLEEVQIDSPDGKGFEEVRVLPQRMRQRRFFRRDPGENRLRLVEETLEVADQFVVRFENYLTDDQIEEMVRGLGMKVEKKLTSQTYVISFGGTRIEESLVAKAKIHNELPVQAVEPRYLLKIRD